MESDPLRSRSTTLRFCGRVSLVGLLFGTALDAPSGSVQPFLSQDGRDVSTSIEAQVVLTPLTGTEGAPIDCLPVEPCPIPPGRYAIGVRSPTHVALDRPTFVSDTEAAGVPSRFVIRVHPAALLALAPGRCSQGKVLTAIDVESGLTFKTAAGPDGAIVQVPARRIVVALFRDGKIPEVWRPVSPKPGERLELPERPPLAKGRGQLVVSLLFPAKGTRGGNKTVQVRWERADGGSPPDIVVTGDPWRWTGFWFDLPAGEGSIVVESKSWALTEKALLPIPDRGVGFARELKVIPRPRIVAHFEKNDRLPVGEAEVELLDCRRLSGQAGPPHYSLCTQVSTLKRIAGGAFLFEGLDPVLHALRWRAGPFRDVHLVSLRDGVSKDVAIPVTIHRVIGTVLRHSRSVPGTKMTWRHYDTGIESRSVTDEEGRFEALLAPSGQYALFLDGPDFERHAEVLDVDEDLDTEFRIPGNTTAVRVLESESGRPVPGARVGWFLETKGTALNRRFEAVTCDDEGRVQLPPFPPGQVTVTARARGYRPSDEQKLQITKDSTAAELELRLRKGIETTLRLTDTDGNPSKGAWAMLPSGARTEPADDAGHVYFEELVRTGDLVFAASAAGSVVLARFTGKEVPIRIPPPSPPFTVRFLTADGRPAPSEQLHCSIDGVRVPQPMDYLARRASGGDVSSRADGSLLVSGLPASGTVALWPARKPNAFVTRPLPVTETIELPAP